MPKTSPSTSGWAMKRWRWSIRKPRRGSGSRSTGPGRCSNDRLSALVVDLGQGLERGALDVLQEGAAAGGDVGHLVGQAELLDGLGRLPAADDGDRPGPGQRLGDGPRALAVRLVLELAQRPVP